MLSVGLVIDTNVLVSAALKLDSLQRTAFLLAITKPAHLYVSAPVLDDYADVLSHPKLGIRKGFSPTAASARENQAARCGRLQFGRMKWHV